jgi:nitroimidazol reductase NimA-like FMN-containing flavoprotein (pyridoxamine 5'-phosphate oxidase superfamily)
VIKTELVKNRTACNWGMEYMSIIGEGYVNFIENADKKIEALDIVMSKYSKNKNNSFEYLETAINKIILIKIEITDLTGKI